MRNFKTCCQLRRWHATLQHKHSWNNEDLQISTCPISGSYFQDIHSASRFVYRYPFRSEVVECEDGPDNRPERDELGGLEIEDSLAWFCIEQSCSAVTADLDDLGDVSVHSSVQLLLVVLFIFLARFHAGSDKSWCCWAGSCIRETIERCHLVAV